MKKIFLGVAFLSAFAFAKAQTVEEIVNKHIEARGGKANFEKMKTLIMEGMLNVQGAEIKMTFTKVVGKLSRQDISFMGTNGYDLTTDKDGWTFMPFAGQTAPVEKTGEALKEAQKGLNALSENMLFDYASKGEKLELQGTEDISGTDCFKLKLTDKAGDSSFIYVDPATYQIARVSSVKTLMGQTMPVTVDFSDYKDVEGMKFPFTLTSPQGPVTFTSIKVNQPVDEKMYKHD